MKFILIALFSAVLTARIFSADVPRALPTVAVSDFIGQAEARNYGDKVTALVTASLASETNLIMLDRPELNKTLNEQALGMSGLVSSDAAARIGQITGAKVLVSGQVIMLGDNRLVLIANIIGTETARLFAAKIDGPADKLVELASVLSSKIAQTITGQATNLITEVPESKAGRIERIIKNIAGTNRPTISVGFYHGKGPQDDPSFTANTEMGVILQKAGFTLVDGNSDQRPDIEISGLVGVEGVPTRHGLHTEHAFVQMKVQERRTGLILSLDRQESVAVDASQTGAQRSAQAQAVDELAARLLPVLAK